MDEEEYGELRRYYEEEQGLDEIEMRGYRIKEATHLIWKGERDMNVLGRGLDIDSAMIVQRILMHTLSIEQKVQEFLATDGALVDEDDKEEHQQEDSNEKEKIPH
jgi:hypothetical protein